MLPRLLPAAAVAAALAALPAAADAATFTVVKATHTSSSAKTEGDYSGRSTAAWTLRRPARIAISRSGTAITGLSTLKVRGHYDIDAGTSLGRCAWTAATGAGGDYAALAPEETTLALGPDPRTGKGLIASFSGVAATLSNPYLGSECSTSITGEPAGEETSAVALAPAALKRKRVVLRDAGATTREGIDYRWKTVVVLRRA
jgi:opacity protein-like surface antigen